MTRRRAIARRSIPVAEQAPVQLPLALRWDQPIEHLHAAPQPGPAPVVALRRAVAA